MFALYNAEGARPSMIHSLLVQLNDPNPQHRLDAIKGLEGLIDPVVTAALITRLEVETDLRVQVALLTILKNIGTPEALAAGAAWRRANPFPPLAQPREESIEPEPESERLLEDRVIDQEEAETWQEIPAPIDEAEDTKHAYSEAPEPEPLLDDGLLEDDETWQGIPAPVDEDTLHAYGDTPASVPPAPPPQSAPIIEPPPPPKPISPPIDDNISLPSPAPQRPTNAPGRSIHFGSSEAATETATPVVRPAPAPPPKQAEQGVNRGAPPIQPQGSRSRATSVWPISDVEYQHQLNNPIFSAYFPNRIQASQPYSLLVYVHIAIAESLVAHDATQYRPMMGGSQGSASVGSQVLVGKGENITFVPRIEGITFTPAEQVVNWDHKQDFIKAPFLFTAPAQLTQPLSGVIQVYKGVFIAGEIPVTLNIQPTPYDEVLTKNATYHAFDPLFASYSHKDSPVMEYFRQQKTQLGQKMWVDIYDLRAGEHWNSRLLEMIDQSAAVQLFWSAQSAESTYCRQEWQHALQLAGDRPRFIQPVWWETPMPTPPVELAHLHFQKITLPLMTRAQLWGKKIKGWLGGT